MAASATAWHKYDKDANITLSLARLRATGSGAAWSGIRTRAALPGTGKLYFEIVCVAVGGGFMAGIGTSSETLTYPGDTVEGYGAFNLGDFYHDTTSPMGVTFTTGDVIGIAIDEDAGKLWFSKNDVWMQSGDPGAGTNENFASLSGTFFPMVGLHTAAIADLRTRAEQFTGTIPSGFSAMDGNHAWELNPEDVGDVTSHGDRLSVSLVNKRVTLTADGSWYTVRGKLPLTRDKNYFEWTAGQLGASGAAMIGIADINLVNESNYPGNDANSWGFFDLNGTYYTGGAEGGDLGDAYDDGDIIGVAVDIVAQKIYWSINGVWQSSNPSAGTGGISIGSGTYYPAIGLIREADYADVEFTLGNFSYTPPTGFTAPENAGPTAVASATPTEGNAPSLEVSFTGSNSTDDIGVTTYSWDFGDLVGTSSEADPTYEYTEEGVYTAVLTVYDVEGLSDVHAGITITVDAALSTGNRLMARNRYDNHKIFMPKITL
jgi:hypothetical protein